MNKFLEIILEYFYPTLLGLFLVLCCMMTGQFGWALIIGALTGIIFVVLLIIAIKEHKKYQKRKNEFRKWTRGK